MIHLWTSIITLKNKIQRKVEWAVKFFYVEIDTEFVFMTRLYARNKNIETVKKCMYPLKLWFRYTRRFENPLTNLRLVSFAHSWVYSMFNHKLTRNLGVVRHHRVKLQPSNLIEKSTALHTYQNSLAALFFNISNNSP